MSTRCQVIIKDQWNEIWFYRHSDGYPKGVKPSLDKFVELVRKGKIRDNAEQAAGWLVLIGAVEYQTLNPALFHEAEVEPWKRSRDIVPKFTTPKDDMMGWKCGAYEPCETKCLHSDIEHLYEIDLVNKEWREITIPAEIKQ